MACLIVQCKAHAKEIGPGPVRDLYGCLMHHGAAEAWLITIHGFTSGAEQFAENKPLSLLTIEDILEDPDRLL